MLAVLDPDGITRFGLSLVDIAPVDVDVEPFPQDPGVADAEPARGGAGGGSMRSMPAIGGERAEPLQRGFPLSIPGRGVGGPGDSFGEMAAAAYECPAPWWDPLDLDLQREAQERPDQHDQPEDGHVL